MLPVKLYADQLDVYREYDQQEKWDNEQLNQSIEECYELLELDRIKGNEKHEQIIRDLISEYSSMMKWNRKYYSGLRRKIQIVN